MKDLLDYFMQYLVVAAFVVLAVVCLQDKDYALTVLFLFLAGVSYELFDQIEP